MYGRSGFLSAAAMVTLMAVVVVVDSRPPVRGGGGDSHQPQTPEVTNHNVNGTGGGSGDWDLGVPYNRYLKEVVQVLESDKDFRKKLEDSDPEKIRDGSIADHLNFVDRSLRTKLDDIKMREVQRLGQLAIKKARLEDRGMSKADMEHLHVDTTKIKFEVEDLKRLIKSTTDDLEEADKQRREDFKKYEMEKKFAEHERLKTIADEEERKKEEERLKALKEKHKEHPKVHHPMSKDQIEEVWEEADHMDPENFDPKTFFAMHDLNGDGHWDQEEIKTLFIGEIEKVYDPSKPEDDMKEKFEEIERMREHAMKEMDHDKDGMISLKEFEEKTNEQDFEKDEGWDPIGEHEDDYEYTDEDYKQFAEERRREMEEMMSKGIMPPEFQNLPHGGVPPPFPGQGVPGSIPGQPAYIPPPSAINPGGHQPPPMPAHPAQPAGMPQQQQQQFNQQPPVGYQQQQQQQVPVHPGQPAAQVPPVNAGSIPGQPAMRPPQPAGQQAGQPQQQQQGFQQQQQQQQFQQPQQFQQQQFQQAQQQQQQQQYQQAQQQQQQFHQAQQQQQQPNQFQQNRV